MCNLMLATNARTHWRVGGEYLNLSLDLLDDASSPELLLRATSERAASIVY